MPKIIFFPYMGPSRRSDRRVIEARLEFSRAEAREPGFEAFARFIAQALGVAGILEQGDRFPFDPFPDRHMRGYASLLVQTALLLQRKAGHRVGLHGLLPDPARLLCSAWCEHEHANVGKAAMQLAADLLTGQVSNLGRSFQAFRKFASERLLPRETEALIEAARSRGVPSLQLDRPPFPKSDSLGERIRRNAHLQLGQGSRARVLDGSFIWTGSGEDERALRRRPYLRAALLERLGLPRASGAAAVSAQLAVWRVGDHELALEKAPDGRWRTLQSVPTQPAAWAERIQEGAGGQPLALWLAALEDGSWVVLDFEPGPDLGELLEAVEGESRLRRAAGWLVDWLFPDPADSRIPVACITGTNGKTTTSRMLAHIMREAGYLTGMICTDETTIDGETVYRGDNSAVTGHAPLLADSRVEAAVLETHHRGIAVMGFAFHSCNVAMALNVTEEHLKVGEIESVDDMAVVKRALLERAQDAAVLFADDPRCVAMLPFLTARQCWLVSLDQGRGQVRALAGARAGGMCLVEIEQGHEWLVLYEGDERLPLMPSGSIPATFDGTARFNVSNAMHAVCAARVMGIGSQVIVAALERFRAGPKQTPGRLNVYDILRFRVVVDFAHTPDGLAKLTDFADRQPVEGRRVVAMSIAGGRIAAIHREVARAAAGHYDLYFCKDYPNDPNKGDVDMTGRLRDDLLGFGVDESQIKLTTEGKEAAFEILDACLPGDLLIYMSGYTEIKEMGSWIEEYAARKEPERLGNGSPEPSRTG